MINIMISDPDLFAREGIKQMLAKYPDLVVTFEADSVQQIFHGLHEVRPDVCLLEISMAKHSWLGLVRDVKRQAHGIPTLVMSHCHERDFALRTLRAGAAGYLPKDCTDEQLACAIRTAATRRPYVSDTLCELIAESIIEGSPKRQHDHLSDTDFEIFCLVAQSMPVAKIAGICNLSVGVVRARRNRIMAMMALRTEAQLVEYAIKRNLIGQAYSAS
ncbi:MAG: response regulator transcription factor [Oxalobacteraceae bacterium]|nr:MAG: response regulator transcription factor [Oxalobacteraceae bacterium]